MLTFAEFSGLVFQLILARLDVIFTLAEFVIPLVDFLIMLTFELKELLFCLQNLLLLDVLSLQLRLFDDGGRPAFCRSAAYRYINCQGKNCAGNGC